MKQNEIKDLMQAMQSLKGEEVPHHKDIEYHLFGDGEHEEQAFDRLIPTWGRIEQVERVMIKAPDSLATKEYKAKICQRNGWEHEDEEYNDINARVNILKVIAKDFPNKFDIKDLNLTEVNKMINHFLASRNASF